MNDNNDVNSVEAPKDSIKEAIEAEVKKMGQQNIKYGIQTACGTILTIINQTMNKPGKITLNDYRRLIKKISEFCKHSIEYTEEDSEKEPIKNE